MVEESAADRAALARYGTIPIAFEVTSRLAVRPGVESGLGGLLLVVEPVALPYTKDYDSDKGEGPTRWHRRWNLSRWCILAAFDGEERVGGAVLARDTRGVNMLEGRSDLAALWDLRVRPEHRGCGVGHALFGAAKDWARARGCRELKFETQNINVVACRFYARQGCELRSIVQGAYPELPAEVQLLWYKRL
jgi:GNAT superfamily N-acetyltransferase